MSLMGRCLTRLSEGKVRKKKQGTVRFKYWTEVRYAGTVRFKERGT